MAVGIAFLRRRPDNTWEGHYELVGGGTFWDFYEFLSSLNLPLGPSFYSWREDEYEVEIDEGPPPYPARVSPELARDLERWLETDGKELLEALRRSSSKTITRPSVRWLKILFQCYLAEGYAIVISY